MRSDVWYLHSVNIIISADHSIEPMLPVHCHKWIAVIIVEKKSSITINYLLQFRWFPILNYGLAHHCHILCHGNLSLSCLYFSF